MEPPGPSGPQGPQGPLRPLVRTTRAQSLREQRNSLKLSRPPQGPQGPQGLKGPRRPPSPPEGKPISSWGPPGGPLKESAPRGAHGAPKRFIDFIKANKKAVAQTEPKKERQETPRAEIVKHKSFGMVPKYMRVSRKTTQGFRV